MRPDAGVVERPRWLVVGRGVYRFLDNPFLFVGHRAVASVRWCVFGVRMLLSAVSDQ